MILLLSKSVRVECSGKHLLDTKCIFYITFLVAIQFVVSNVTYCKTYFRSGCPRMTDERPIIRALTGEIFVSVVRYININNSMLSRRQIVRPKSS